MGSDDRRAPRTLTMPAGTTTSYVIVCDESGYSGPNLLDAHQRFMTHASTDLSPEMANEVIKEVRQRSRMHDAEEMKWKSLQKRRPDAVRWLLAESGPLAGHAKLIVADKLYTLVAKIIDLLVEVVEYEAGNHFYASSGQARKHSRILFRNGERAFGKQAWSDLLEAFLKLAKEGDATAGANFVQMVDDLRLRGHVRAIESIMDSIWQARAEVGELLDPDSRIATMNPIYTMLPTTIRLWWDDVREPIFVLHDETNALNDEVVKLTRLIMANPLPEHRRVAPPVPFSGLEKVNSKTDARVQVADLLAGAGRVCAERAWLGEESDLFVGHFIHPGSMWADEPSWLRLSGRPADSR